MIVKFAEEKPQNIRSRSMVRTMGRVQTGAPPKGPLYVTWPVRPEMTLTWHNGRSVAKTETMLHRQAEPGHQRLAPCLASSSGGGV
jgi:hypothetical protein